MKNNLELLSLERDGNFSEKVYTVFDLKNLSSVALYTSELPPMSAAGAFLNRSLEIDWSIPNGYERPIAQREIPIETPILKPIEVPVFERYTENYGGDVSWGQSFGRSTDYIKQTELGELHVHAPKGFITGANLEGEPISNYWAAIIDLLEGKVVKDKGKW